MTKSEIFVIPVQPRETIDDTSCKMTTMKISSLKLTDLLFYLCQEYNPAVENTDLSKPKISSTFNPNVLLPDAHIQESANSGIGSVFIVRIIEVKFDDIPSSGSLFYSLKHVRFTQCPFQ